MSVEALHSNQIVPRVIDIQDHNYHPDELVYLEDGPLIWDQERGKQSIFESYDPKNDAERLQKLSHLTPELQRYYIKENLLSYFEEFAAEIRVKSLSGVIRDTGEMEILGTNVTDMYTHSAELAGPGSREDKERRGLNTIVTGLREGNNRALWTSPPTFADYGFVFTFVADDYDEQLKGRPFREVLLRYDEDLESIEKSKQIYTAIQLKTGIASPESDTFQASDDFLEYPFIYSSDGAKDMYDIYELLAIKDQDIEKSELFRTELQPYIEPMMDEYVNLLRQISLYDLQHTDKEVEELISQCEMFIGGMFNTARIIARKIDKKHDTKTFIESDQYMLQELRDSNISLEMMYHYAQQMASYEELSIEGGSNCPVARSLGSTESSFLESVSSGISFNAAGQLIGLEPTKRDKEECVTCPRCKNSKGNIKVKGRYICGNRSCPTNRR